jgi:hypothetical protein
MGYGGTLHDRGLLDGNENVSLPAPYGGFVGVWAADCGLWSRWFCAVDLTIETG